MKIKLFSALIWLFFFNDEYAQGKKARHTSEKFTSYRLKQTNRSNVRFYQKQHQVYSHNFNFGEKKTEKKSDFLKTQTQIYVLPNNHLKNQPNEKANIAEQLVYHKKINNLLCLLLILVLTALGILIYFFMRKRHLYRRTTKAHDFIVKVNHDLSTRLKEQLRTLRRRNKKILHYGYINSHRLRAPITSLMGLINLLKIEKNAEKRAEILKKIENNVNRLDQVSKKIRVVLQLEQEKQEQFESD